MTAIPPTVSPPPNADRASGTATVPESPSLPRFIPNPLIRERYGTRVHAPAGLVFSVAEHFDLMSIALVRAIFRLREIAMHAHHAPVPVDHAFFAQARSMGWGLLAHHKGREHVMGASTQPWLADVVFEPIPAERFAGYAEPGRVKIAWSVETHPLSPTLTYLATETRAVATDDEARWRFLRYWGRVRAGVLLIRWLVLPRIRREAERRWQSTRPQIALGAGFIPPERKTVHERPIPLPPP